MRPAVSLHPIKRRSRPEARDGSHGQGRAQCQCGHRSESSARDRRARCSPQLLHRNGIESVILEQRSCDYVLARVRAGVLEQGAVKMFEEAVFADRLHCEGLVHDGTEIAFGGRRHHISFKELVGKSVVVYGQTEITKDLVDARAASGGMTVYEAENVAIHGIDTATGRASPTSRTAPSTRSTAISLRDAMASTASAGRLLPASILKSYERVYPFGWMGILADVPPVSPELIYSAHERGFALASMRSMTRSRYYIQCRADERIEDWPDDRLWDELKDAWDRTRRPR